MAWMSIEQQKAEGKKYCNFTTKEEFNKLIYWSLQVGLTQKPPYSIRIGKQGNFNFVLPSLQDFIESGIYELILPYPRINPIFQEMVKNDPNYWAKTENQNALTNIMNQYRLDLTNFNAAKSQAVSIMMNSNKFDIYRKYRTVCSSTIFALWDFPLQPIIDKFYNGIYSEMAIVISSYIDKGVDENIIKDSCYQKFITTKSYWS